MSAAPGRPKQARTEGGAEDAPASGSGRNALVVGGSGLVGGHLVQALARERWNIVSTQRQAPLRQPATHRILALDLLDTASVGSVLEKAGEVSHLFFLARTFQDGYRIDRDANVRILENVLDAIQDLTSLRHVQLIHGLKWYGSTLGPFPTPARESDPRPPVEHFYYDQHALIAARSRGRAWHWSTLRPHCVSGVARGSPSNLMLGMAVYASLMKEMALPLAFPGSEASFGARLTYSSADLLARAMLWAATEPRASDEDFNVANGDVFSWRQVWPGFARLLGMEPAPPKALALAQAMPRMAEAWRALAAREGLAQQDLAALVDWNFMDATLALEWPQIMSVEKLHRFGFGETVDTPKMIAGIIEAYRNERILPAS